MTTLNNTHPHSRPGSAVDALTLLHFVADATRDWECLDLCEGPKCPFYLEITRMPEKKEIKFCILEGIKDQAQQWLDVESDNL